MKTTPDDVYILLQLDPKQKKCLICLCYFNPDETVLYINRQYDKNFQFTTRCFWCYLDGYIRHHQISIEELSLLYHPQFIPYDNQVQWVEHVNKIDKNRILYG